MNLKSIFRHYVKVSAHPYEGLQVVLGCGVWLWTEEQRERFRAICGEAMGYFGYEVGNVEDVAR